MYMSVCPGMEGVCVAGEDLVLRRVYVYLGMMGTFLLCFPFSSSLLELD